MAGRLRAYDSLEFHRKIVLEKNHHWQMLGGLCYAAQAFCLEPEIAGLQMCARFCLVYHGYCCGENFVLFLNIHSPTHMHNHNAHTHSLAEDAEPACLKPRPRIQRHFREIDGSQRTVRGKDILAITGDAASQGGGQENNAERQG